MLADPGTGYGLADDIQEQVVAMEPVGGGEGAGGEGSAAVEAAVASERLGRGWRVIEAPMAVVPEGRGFVEGAVAVGTVRKACGRAEGERPRRVGPLATRTAGRRDRGGVLLARGGRIGGGVRSTRPLTMLTT